MKELTPEMVQEAWVMAAHEYQHECFEDGTEYCPFPSNLLYSGFTLQTILEHAKPERVDALILLILSWDVKHLTECFIRAHRVGHRNHLHVPLMGHVHRSQLPSIHKEAKEYFESL